MLHLLFSLFLEFLDFVIVINQVILNATSRSGNFSLFILGDDIPEPTKDLVLLVQSDSDGVIIEPSSLTLIIFDDDNDNDTEGNWCKIKSISYLKALHANHQLKIDFTHKS